MKNVRTEVINQRVSTVGLFSHDLYNTAQEKKRVYCTSTLAFTFSDQEAQWQSVFGNNGFSKDVQAHVVIFYIQAL